MCLLHKLCLTINQLRHAAPTCRPFQICITKAKDWEKKLENLSRLWRVLHQKQHTLEAWLDQAQAVLEDTEDDYESLIRKHKSFFVRVDERMLQDYLRACQDILIVLEEEDRPALTESMENIQQRWEVRTSRTAGVLRVVLARLIERLT